MAKENLPDPNTIKGLSDAIKSLGDVGKKDAKNASKSLKAMTGSLLDFNKKLGGKEINATVSGMDDLATGMSKFGDMGRKQRKNITKVLDDVGVSMVQFNRRTRAKNDAGKNMKTVADAVEKLGTVSRKNRKGIVKDLSAIAAAFGMGMDSVKGGGEGSKLAAKEQAREQRQAAKEEQEKQLLVFDTIGSKLDALTDATKANKPEKKSGVFGGLIGALVGLPGLLISGIKGFLPDWLVGGSGVLMKTLGGLPGILFKSGGLLMGLVKPLFGLLTGPLGLIAGAGILGAMAGKWLHDNLVGPWIDGYYEKVNEGSNEASRNVAKEVSVMTEKGREKVFRANEELAKAFDGKEFITQSELAQYAEAKGSSVEALLAEGNVKAAVALQTAQGTSRFGMKEEMTLEELAGRNRMEEEREALQRMSQGYSEDTTTGEMKRLDNKDRLIAHRKNILMREAQQLYDMEQQLHNLIGKEYPDNESANKASYTAAGVLSNAESAWNRIIGHGGRQISQGTPLYHSDVEKLKNAFPLLWEWRGHNVDDSGNRIFLDGWANYFYPKMQKVYGKTPGAKWNAMGGGPGIMGNQWNSLPGDVPFAMGGLVRGPVRGLIGEAGPELVLPLNKAPQVIGDILSKAASNLSRTQVGLQGVMSKLSGKGGGASSIPNIVTNTVMSNSSSSYTSPPKDVRDVYGIQNKLASI